MVKKMHAILLLVLYGTFTVMTALASHSCPGACKFKGDWHLGFTESSTPPSECSEKEAVNNLPAEHRTGTIVKFSPAARVNDQSANSSDGKKAVSVYRPESYKGVQLSNTSLYISHCVYRL